MTTAVRQAANILGMREEFLNELLVLVNMTSGARPNAARPDQSADHYAFMTEPLVDEYANKC